MTCWSWCVDNAFLECVSSELKKTKIIFAKLTASQLHYGTSHEQHGVPNHLHITVTSQWARWRIKYQPNDCLLNRLFRRRSKKTSKFRVTGNSQMSSEFPAQMASNAENVSIWWRHHASSQRQCVQVLDHQKDNHLSSVKCSLEWLPWWTSLSNILSTLNTSLTFFCS